MTLVHPRCSFVPPYLLEAVAAAAEPHVAAHARRTLEADVTLRGRRQGRADMARTGAARLPELPEPGTEQHPQRVVSDAHGNDVLPGDRVRGEGDPATGDVAVDEACDGLGSTWALYREVYDRNSLDGRGLPLLATVHYGKNYDNAFWDGTQMVLGDGDGHIFQRFTRSLDVIGHELTHGVTELTAGLTYQNQPGALNESISDVFGVLAKQHALGQAADQADWLVGADLFTSRVHGVALRSMKSPGTAYDDPVLGKDPQPAHMSNYVTTRDDNGGVHINSGIPNHAFYLAATAIGGFAWEVAGWIWYAALTGDGIRADCDFATFASLTTQVARERYGADSGPMAAVQQAWSGVGVTEVPSSGPSGPGSTDTGRRVPVPGHALAEDSELRLRRTGGLAGLVRERRVLLGELPEQDTRDWKVLLSRRGLLDELAQSRTHPDAFCYGVQCLEVGVDVQIPEPALNEDLRGLFDRTLNA
jgi:hypothetical protein